MQDRRLLVLKQTIGMVGVNTNLISTKVASLAAGECSIAIPAYHRRPIDKDSCANFGQSPVTILRDD